MSATSSPRVDGRLLARSKQLVFGSEFEEFVYYQPPSESWRKLVVVLKAYLDESGWQPGSSVLSLAGFVGGARQWVELDRHWRSELEKAELEEFHAKEFFTQGFRGWDAYQKTDFLDKLTKPVHRLRLYPIGGAVPASSFSELSAEARRYLTGGQKRLPANKWVRSGKPSAAYFLIFPFALAKAAQRAQPGVKVHFFLDQHDQYEGYAKNWFKDFKKIDKDFGDRFGDITFSDSAEHPGLQLADLLAYLLYQDGSQNADAWTEDKPRDPSQHFEDPLQKYCFQRLARRGQGNLIRFSGFTLERLLSQLPKDIRTDVVESLTNEPSRHVGLFPFGV